MKVVEKIMYILIFMTIPLIIYFSYKAYRYVNWNFGYKDKVIEQIKIEIKKECLK